MPVTGRRRAQDDQSLVLPRPVKRDLARVIKRRLAFLLKRLVLLLIEYDRAQILKRQQDGRS